MFPPAIYLPIAVWPARRICIISYLDLEVGEHGYRFQDRIVKVLRFVNHDHNAPAGAEFADQGVIQLAVHAPQVIRPDHDARSVMSERRNSRGSQCDWKKRPCGRVSQLLQESERAGGFPIPALQSGP